MKVVRGDILDAKHGIICHQVNCQLVMGAGLAKQIRDKYPIVFSEYSKLSGTVPMNKRLGKCQVVEVKPKDLFVANLFGQFAYGRIGVHTDYGALAMAMGKLNEWHMQNCHRDFPIWVPYGIGCGLAGGDWKRVVEVVESQVPKAIIVKR